ncbi:MAG: hypothetical protein H6555_02215 [Lewinellaceae bacterium]|nr:hypothetical protein [Lewinellaceae bacterium]
MKQFFLLFSLLCSIAIAHAQQSAYYTIHVGTFIGAKAQDFDQLRPMGFLYAFEMENNYFQVYLGEFDQRTQAERLLPKVKAAGYGGAEIQERPLNQGRTVTIIQIATVELEKPIRWERYNGMGELFGIISGNRLKLVTGVYESLNEARQALSDIQGKGFSDAFVKNVNSMYLHRLGPFETQNQLKKPLIPIKIEDKPLVKVQPSANEPRTTTTSYDQPPTRPATTTPRSGTPVYPGATETTGRGWPPAASATPAKTLPTIRVNVKRRSALELQKVLKAEKTYAGALDGYYGAGTQQGYETALKQNPELQKYSLLMRYQAAGSMVGEDQLQQTINRLADDPNALLALEGQSQPIAKAYQAYVLYQTLGPSNEVNNLMNTAIQAAFSTGKRVVTQLPPFDYRATYAYNDLDQLVLHLLYVHGAPGNTYAAPCWLFRMHPQETARAQATFSGFSAAVPVQNCDQFQEWPEVRLMSAIAIDLAGQQPSQQELTQASSERSRLYLSQVSLSQQSQKQAQAWQDGLWENLNAWAQRDPLNQRLITAFKVPYFQSQVRLEDFYMDKGFSSDEAKGMAIATLATLVGPYVKRFM